MVSAGWRMCVSYRCRRASRWRARSQRALHAAAPLTAAAAAAAAAAVAAAAAAALSTTAPLQGQLCHLQRRQRRRARLVTAAARLSVQQGEQRRPGSNQSGPAPKSARTTQRDIRGAAVCARMTKDHGDGGHGRDRDWVLTCDHCVVGDECGVCAVRSRGGGGIVGEGGENAWKSRDHASDWLLWRRLEPPKLVRVGCDVLERSVDRRVVQYPCRSAERHTLSEGPM